jgi:hypothetical protein
MSWRMTRKARRISAFISYMPDQRYEGYNGSATVPKKSIIYDQKSKAAKRMAEVCDSCQRRRATRRRLQQQQRG